MKLFPLLLLLPATVVNTEKYESCLTHPSEAYLKAFEEEHDRYVSLMSL